MPRNDSALRILEIGKLLERTPQGLTVKELRDRLVEQGYVVTERTTYRDLQAASAFFPIYEIDKTETGSTRFGMRNMMQISTHLVLHPNELFALYFAQGALQPLEHTPFYVDLQRVFAKLDGLLNEKGKEHLRELAGHMHFDPAPKWGLGVHPDLLETIRAACDERHVIKAMYAGTRDHTPRARRLGPHFLYYSKGGIYLVAEDLEARQVKTYAIPRFQTAEMLEEAYATDPVDPAQFFASSFGIFAADQAEEVELEVEPEVAKFIAERQWHSSQRVVFLEGGRARVRFLVALTPEFVSWVLGFGPSVKVIQPMRLVAKIVKLAAQVRDLYWNKAG